jgi:hypothetical protein
MSHHRLHSAAASLTCAVLATTVLVACGSSTQLDFGAGGSSQLDPETAEKVYDLTVEAIKERTDDVNSRIASGEVATADGDTEAASLVAVQSSFGTLLLEWTSCYHRPARCDVESLTAPESPERDRLRESLAFYTTEQIRTRPDEGRLEWGIESLTMPTDDRARLLTCEYDTRVYFDSSMADTELGDIIFDTTIWTRRVEWTLSRVDDEWRLYSRRIDRRSPVARFCQP